jgi:predicted DsbA family dithiol-disulfide isomerase
LLIEIFSDVVCPWCYIGKRRLDRALEAVGDDVDVAWRAYQLYPEMPPEGVDRKAFMRARFGAGQGRSGVAERLQGEASEAGVELNFDRIEVMPNTFAAHRLLALAEAENVQHELAEALFRAYFVLGHDVGDPAVLQRQAEAVGMDGRRVAAYLSGDEGGDTVREQLETARLAGVSGVPFYVLAGSFGIPGAQSVETFTQVIGRAKERLAGASG